MASSFEKAFTQAYQAEMARRKEAEAEIAREIRAEKRFEREMEARRELQLESEDRAHLAKLAEEERLDARLAARREEEKIDKSSVAASEAADKWAGRALDFRGDWEAQIKALEAEDAYNARADVLGIPRIGGGADIVYATPEQRASMARAEEEYTARQKKEGVFSEAEARAMAQIKSEGTPEFKALKSDRERQASLSAARNAWHEAFISLQPGDRAQIDTEGGVLTDKGIEQLKRRFGQQTIESTDPITGNTIRTKTTRLLKEDVLPLESRTTGQPAEPAGAVYGPIPERSGWGRTGNVGVESGFLKSTEQYVPTLPAAPSSPTQGTPIEEEDQDFFSYLDKIRKSKFVQPVEAISGPIPYATKLATDALTDSELWKKYGPSDKLKHDLTPPWLRPKPPTPPSTKPWSQDYYTR